MVLWLLENRGRMSYTKAKLVQFFFSQEAETNDKPATKI